MKYQVGKAYDFYRKFIYNEEKQSLLVEHNLHVAGSVPSIDWELFGALLTGDKGKTGYGSDLEHYEIKSSVNGASFEYQYHLNGGQQKLLDDMQVDHLFISYSPDYKDIEVRLMHGPDLKEKFEAWMPGLQANYQGENPRQRFRRSIPFGAVRASGVTIMKVEQGQLVQSES